MIPLTSRDQLKEVYKESFVQKVGIFKHSSTCPISARAYALVTEAVAHDVLKLPIYLVVVQESREVSDRIAEDLGITHESPQFLVLKQAQVVRHASHHAINNDFFSS